MRNAPGRALSRATTQIDVASSRQIVSQFDTLSPVSNPLPSNGVFARRVPVDVARRAQLGHDIRLAHPSRADAFITAGDDLIGARSSLDVSQRLALIGDDGFLDDAAGVVYFRLRQPFGLASPIGRTDPGFVPFGRTFGNAREFLLPNRPLSELGAEVIDVKFFGR